MNESNEELLYLSKRVIAADAGERILVDGRYVSVAGIVARALVERLEPVQVRKFVVGTGWECLGCRGLVKETRSYCPNCGRPIKW